jgi:ribosome-associated protein
MTVQDSDSQNDEFDGQSRSQSKRDAAWLKNLGAELVTLGNEELDALPLSEKLRDAIDLAKEITAHGGAARQRQFIGKLLRHSDVDALIAVIDRRNLDKKLAAREFHRIEVWRDRLLNEGESAVTALLTAHPGLPVEELTQFLRSATQEASTGRPPAAARALFKWLRDRLATPDRSA